MSEFADFTGAPSANDSSTNPENSNQTDLFGSADPTADFLARESAILGDASQAFAQTSDTSAINGFSDFSSANAGGSANDAASQPIGDGIPALQDNTFGPLSAQYPQTSVPDAENMPSPSPSSAPAASPYVPEIEPEIIREHRARQAQLIAERDAKSERKRQENIEAAKRAIDKFYEDYNNKREKAIKENRENQNELVASLNDHINGTIWDRVVKHIDLATSESSSRKAATTATGQKKVGQTKDVSRMKAILQNLKGDPNAPGCVAPKA